MKVIMINQGNQLVVRSRAATLTNQTFLKRHLSRALTSTLTNRLRRARQNSFNRLVLNTITYRTFSRTTRRRVTINKRSRVRVISRRRTASVTRTRLTNSLFEHLRITAHRHFFRKLTLTSGTTNIRIGNNRNFNTVSSGQTTKQRMSLALRTLARLKISKPLIRRILTFVLNQIPLLRLILRIKNRNIGMFLSAIMSLIAFRSRLTRIIIRSITRRTSNRIKLTLRRLQTLTIPRFLTLNISTLPLTSR